jgi:hypothetical protein
MLADGVKQSYGAPERIRTSDLSLRRAALYPAELRARGDIECSRAFYRIGSVITITLFSGSGDWLCRALLPPLATTVFY